MGGCPAAAPHGGGGRGEAPIHIQNSIETARENVMKSYEEAMKSEVKLRNIAFLNYLQLTIAFAELFIASLY